MLHSAVLQRCSFGIAAYLFACFVQPSGVFCHQVSKAALTDLVEKSPMNHKVIGFIPSSSLQYMEVSINCSSACNVQ